MANYQFHSHLSASDSKNIQTAIQLDEETIRYRNAQANSVRFEFCPSTVDGKQYFVNSIGSLQYRLGSKPMVNEPHELDRALTYHHTNLIYERIRKMNQNYISVGGNPLKEMMKLCVHINSKHSISDNERFQYCKENLSQRINTKLNYLNKNAFKMKHEEIDEVEGEIYNMNRFYEDVASRPNTVKGAMCWGGLELCKCKHARAKTFVAVHSVYNINPYDLACYLETKDIESGYIVMQIFPELFKNCPFTDFCYNVRLIGNKNRAPTRFSVGFRGDVQPPYVHELNIYRAWMSMSFIQTKNAYWTITPTYRTGAIYTLKFTKFSNIVLLGNSYDLKLKAAQRFKKKYPMVEKETMIRTYSLADYVLVPDGRWIRALVETGAIKHWRKSVSLVYHRVPKNEWNKLTSFLQALSAEDFDMQKAKQMYRALGNTIWFGNSKLNMSMEITTEAMTAIVTTAMVIAAGKRAIETSTIKRLFAELKKEQNHEDSFFWRIWDKIWYNDFFSYIRDQDAARRIDEDLKHLHNLAAIDELEFMDDFEFNGVVEHSLFIQEYLSRTTEGEDEVSEDSEMLELWLERLKNYNSNDAYTELIDSVRKLVEKKAKARNGVELQQDDMIIVTGPAGCGKTTAILAGTDGKDVIALPAEKKACYEARKNGDLIFVAPSAAQMAEVEEKHINMTSSGELKRNLYTQHNVFKCQKPDVACLVVDECFTYPKGYFIALKLKFPEAQIIALGDINQCGLYDEEKPYKAGEKINSWLLKFPKHIFNTSRSIPTRICEFLNQAGVKISTQSKEEGSLNFTEIPNKAEQLLDFDLVMTMDRESAKYYSDLIDEYIKLTGRDAKMVETKVMTVRAAQGMRCKKGLFIIPMADKAYITSQHHMVYTAFTRTTKDLVVATRDKNMTAYNVNLDYCKIEQNWFVLANFVPYDVQTFDEEPEFLISFSDDSEKAPLFEDHIAISKILLKSTKIPEDINPMQLAVTPTNFIISETKKGRISSSMFDNRQWINFMTGYALPGAKFCKFFFSSDPAQVVATMTERCGDDKNRPKTLTDSDIATAKFMFERFVDRFVDEDKVSELLTNGSGPNATHSRYFEQVCISATQYLDKVREKGGQEFISPMEFFRKELIVEFNLKRIVKNMEEGSASQKEGQGISAWSKNLNCVMCIMHRVFATALLHVLKPHVILGYETSRNQQGDAFQLRVKEAFMEACDDQMDSICIEQVATDITSFDKTQGLETQHFERLVFDKVMNLEGATKKTLVDLYFEMRSAYVLEYKKASRGGVGSLLTFYMTGMKASGEPNTIGMNTLVNMGIFAAVTNAKDEKVATFVGDDSNGVAHAYSTNDLGVKLVGRYIGSTIKFEPGTVKRFTGYFQSPQHGNVTDVVTMAKKMMSQLFRNKEHYEEYQMSITDLLLTADRQDDKLIAKMNALYYTDLSVDDVLKIIGWIRSYVGKNWNEFIASGAEHTRVNPQASFFVDLHRVPKPMIKIGKTEIEEIMEEVRRFELNKNWNCLDCGGYWHSLPCSGRVNKNGKFECISCKIALHDNCPYHICKSCLAKVNDDRTMIGKCITCPGDVYTNLTLKYGKLSFVCPVHVFKAFKKVGKPIKDSVRLHELAEEICTSRASSVDTYITADSTARVPEHDEYEVLTLIEEVQKENFGSLYGQNEKVFQLLTLLPKKSTDFIAKLVENFKQRYQSEDYYTYKDSKGVDVKIKMPKNNSVASINKQRRINETLRGLRKIKSKICNKTTEASSVDEPTFKSFIKNDTPENRRIVVTKNTIGKNSNESCEDLATRLADFEDCAEVVAVEKSRLDSCDLPLLKVPADTQDCFIDAVNGFKQVLLKDAFYKELNAHRQKFNLRKDQQVEVDEGAMTLKNLKVKFAIFVRDKKELSLIACWHAKPTANTKYDCVIVLNASDNHFCSADPVLYNPSQHQLIDNTYCFDGENFETDIENLSSLKKFVETTPWPNLNRWNQESKEKPPSDTNLKMNCCLRMVVKQHRNLVLFGAAKNESFELPMVNDNCEDFECITAVDPRFPNTKYEGNIFFVKGKLSDQHLNGDELVISDVYDANYLNNGAADIVRKLHSGKIMSTNVEVFIKLTTKNLDFKELNDKFTRYFAKIVFFSNPGSKNSTEIWLHAYDYCRNGLFERKFSESYYLLQEHRNKCRNCRESTIGVKEHLVSSNNFEVVTWCNTFSDEPSATTGFIRFKPTEENCYVERMLKISTQAKMRNLKNFDVGIGNPLIRKNNAEQQVVRSVVGNMPGTSIANVAERSVVVALKRAGRPLTERQKKIIGDLDVFEEN